MKKKYKRNNENKISEWSMSKLLTIYNITFLITRSTETDLKFCFKFLNVYILSSIFLKFSVKPRIAHTLKGLIIQSKINIKSFQQSETRKN